MSRVLVADDSASIRLLLKRRLERAGHEVFEARDGEEALAAALGDNSVSPDLILLDVMMPELDGIETLRHIKAQKSMIPVLLVSAVNDSSATKEWELADGYLAKPIDFDELLSRVELLTGGQPQPGSPHP
ncbi:MAG: response regulator [Solirubrobacterales bacterium]